MKIHARLKLLGTYEGGRTSAIFNGYRPDWDLGRAGELNCGQVLLDGELAPGSEAEVRIEPLAPEFWADLKPWAVLPMHEGPHVVGYALVTRIEVP